MSTTAMAEQTLTRVLIERWEQVARKFADLAEEVPEEKFEWTPVPGLRTCGDIVRHVAFWNRYVHALLLGQEADGSANQLPAAEYPTRTKAVAALRDSATEVAAALRQHRGELLPRTLEHVVTFVEHTSEHYGQLAVYARAMGIVPPASRE